MLTLPKTSTGSFDFNNTCRKGNFQCQYIIRLSELNNYDFPTFHIYHVYVLWGGGTRARNPGPKLAKPENPEVQKAKYKAALFNKKNSILNSTFRLFPTFSFSIIFSSSI